MQHLEGVVVVIVYKMFRSAAKNKDYTESTIIKTRAVRN
jgi:hypothetical protein